MCKNSHATSFAQGVLEIWNGCMVSDIHIHRFLFHQFQLHWCCPRRDGMATRRRKGTVRTKHLFRWTMEPQTAAARLSSFSHSILTLTVYGLFFGAEKLHKYPCKAWASPCKGWCRWNVPEKPDPTHSTLQTMLRVLFIWYLARGFHVFLFYFAKR